MSGSIRWQSAARDSGARVILKPGNLLPALIWAFLVYAQILNSPFPPALPNVLLVLINSCALFLFLIRRDPARTGNTWELLIAVLGTFIVALLPHGEDINWVASTIQIIGLLAWAIALASLGRSFGIAPADRGLKQTGPYRFVRHPMYAAELLFFVGFFIAVPTWRTAIIVAIWWALQTVRILREERILEDYADYRARVKWRVLPGVW